MDTLKLLFLEKPAAVFVTMAFAELTILFLLYIRRTRGLLIAAFIPPLVVVAVGLLAWAITTDRERLEWTLRDLAEAVEAMDADRLATRISDDYFDGRYDRERLIRAAGRLAGPLELERITVSAQQVEFTDDGQALMRAGVTATVGVWGRRLNSWWWLHWRLEEDGQWRITHATLESPHNIPGAPGQ